MRAFFVVALVVSSAAGASGFSLGAPLKDERKVVAGRVGASPGDVSARALFVNGNRNGTLYSQAGGEVVLQGGLHFFETSFGALFGIEGDFSLGGQSNEASPDGTLKDQRKEGLSTAEQMKSVVWVTSRLGLRASLSLPVLQLGRSVAFRLGGAMLDANGSRSYLLSPVFTAGAQLSMALGPVAALATYLAIPSQSDSTGDAVAHSFSLELGIGPIVAGASWQVHTVFTRASRGEAGRALSSTTLGFHLGYRFPSLNLR